LERFVGKMPAISLMAVSAVPSGSCARSERFSKLTGTAGGKRSPSSQSGNSNRAFLFGPEQWKLDSFGQNFSPHDDIVDALSQGLNYLRGEGYRPFQYTPAIPRETRNSRWDGLSVAAGGYQSGQSWGRAMDRAADLERRSPRRRWRGF